MINPGKPSLPDQWQSCHHDILRVPCLIIVTAWQIARGFVASFHKQTRTYCPTFLRYDALGGKKGASHGGTEVAATSH